MTDEQPQETSEVPPKRKRRKRTPPATLWQALVAAQACVEPVQHDSKMSFGQQYTYASSEAIIKAARAALHAHGLAVTAGDTAFRDECLTIEFMLAHESGDKWAVERSWPVVESRGQALDKRMAAASTNCLAYYLRDLLLIERPGASDDMNQRKDGPQPQKREVKVSNGKPREHKVSRSEYIASLTAEQIENKVMTGAQQIEALGPTEDESNQLVELLDGQSNPEMLGKVYALFDKVKARLKQTEDVGLF